LLLIVRVVFAMNAILISCAGLRQKC